MDDQQHHQKLAHTSSDHHGVHLCYKCGWPYPNPHPSAKHRRAHKRICGTIEGHKMGDFEGSAHSDVSDDEHLSDEDHNNPSPKVLEASSHEKGSGRTGEVPKLPNRSEDETFSDAAAEEFLDGGIGGKAQGSVEDAGELATNVKKNLKTESNTAQSIDRGPAAEIVKSCGSSPETIQTQHSVTPETTNDRSGFAPELPGSSASFNSNSTVGSVSDGRTEDSAVVIDGDSNASVDDLLPLKSETPEDVSHENEKTVDDVVDGSLKLAKQQTYLEGQTETYFDSNTIDDVVDGSLKLAERRTDLEGQKETYLDSNLRDVKTPPGKVDGEMAEAISKVDKSLKDNSESSSPKPEHGILPLQEDDSLKTSKRDVSPKAESVEHVDALADTAEKTVEIAGLNSLDSDDLIGKREEVDANVHMLSLADHIHVVENPEIMLKDFKDHKVMKLDQSATLECEQAKDKGDDAQGPALEKSSQSNQSEGIVLSSSDKHALEDSVRLDQDSSTRIVKDVLVEGDADLSLFEIEKTESQRSNKIGAFAGVAMPYIDKALSVSSAKKQESRDICNDTSQGNVLGNIDNAVSVEDLAIASGSAGTILETHVVSESGYKQAEKSDLSGDDHNKGARVVDHTENPVTAAETAGSGFQFQVNPTTYLQEGDDAGSFVDITGNDDADVVAHLVKNETEVDSEKESGSECPVVAHGFARNLSEVEIHPVTILWEGNTAGDLDQVETKKDEITDDPRDAVACDAKDETEVCNDNSPSRERYPVVTSESAKNLVEVEINSETNLQEGDTACNFQKVETKKDDITVAACDVSVRDVKDETGIDNDNSPLKKSGLEHPEVIPGSAKNLAEVEINAVTNLQEGDAAGTLDKVETKQNEISGDACDGTVGHVKDELGVDNIIDPTKESLAEHPIVTFEFSKNSSDFKVDPKTNFGEEDTAGNCEKVEVEMDDISGRACGTNSETGVDNNNSLLKEIRSEHPVVASESAKNLAEVEIDSGTDLQKGDTSGNFNEDIIGGACGAKGGIGIDSNNSPSEDTCSEHPVVAPKAAKTICGVENILEPDLRGGDTAGITGCSCEAAAPEAKYETGVDNDNNPSKESFSEPYLVVTPEYAKTEAAIILETKIQEGDTASTFTIVETKKDVITGGSCDAASRNVKDETGVDNDNSLSKERFSEPNLVITPESAKTESEINPETKLQEGDAACNLEKVEIKMDKITRGSCDAAACDVKDETGVANSNSPSKESCSEHPVVAPKSVKILSEINLVTDLQEGDVAATFGKVETKKDNTTGDACDGTVGHMKDEVGADNAVGLAKNPIVARNLSDLKDVSETNLQEEDAAGNFEKVETKRDHIIADSCDAAVGRVGVEIGGANSVVPAKESGPENAAVTCESTNQFSELDVNPATNSQAGDDTFDSEKGRTEKFVEHQAESKEGFVKENLPVQIKSTTESASYPREFQTIADDVENGSTESLGETGVRALDSSRLDDDVVKEIQIDPVDDKLDKNDKVKEELLFSTTAQSNHEREVRPSSYTVDDHVKEAALSPAVEDTSAREFDAASGLDRQQFGGSTHGMSVDSSSQSESLENNWGSVSALSSQSDAQPVVDADNVPKESKSMSERQYPDNSDMFEPPSFVTLVEPGGENDQKATAAENRIKPLTTQAGWFPSITHVVHESQGRKKNEEIIAKVTNQSTSKPHSPFKNLLGEASLDTRAKSPKRKGLAPSPQKDDKAASTINSVLDTESSLDHADHAANREIGNKWNSPARYPTEIKREKRKPKGRPYWAQFMCCSCVH